MKKRILLTLVGLLYASLLFPQCRVLFIGDSVTDGGWGNSGGSMASSEERNHWDKNHIYGHSYMMLCASELESSYPERQYVMLNRGISGDDIQRISGRWQKDALDLNPDVLSILEGTNDVHYFLDSISSHNIPLSEAHYDLDSWEYSYRNLIEQSRKANPDLKLILCSPFVAKAGWVADRPDYELRSQIIGAMANRIRLMAQDYHATYIDFNSLFAELTQRPEGASYWVWDGIHPTPAGHRRMADLWLKQLAYCAFSSK